MLMTGSLFSEIVAHVLQGGKIDALLSAVKMTSREQDVIGHIAAGKSNKEISSDLNIAVHTVKSHVHSILEKQVLYIRLTFATFAYLQGLNKKTPQ